MSKIHEHWSSKIGFIMATAGASVGLGSLWKFPYVAGVNGGGAFVLLYIMFSFLIGLPVFIGELIIGRKTQKSSVLAFGSLQKNHVFAKGLGWFNVVTTFSLLSYYAIIASWVLCYVFMSLSNFTYQKTPLEIQETFTLLISSPSRSFFWYGFFLLINLGIICSGVRKGIEHFSKILMPALFIILITLFIYGTTLSGFSSAFKFVFYPNFEKLTAESILSALGIAFFTLSIGLGINITYGSYLHKKDKIPSNSMIITLMTVFISLISALVIFPIVFTFNFAPEQGPGLIFKTLPVVFSKLIGTTLLSTLFFSLVLFAALTSTIALLEVLVANMMENFSISRKKAATYSTIALFCLGSPSILYESFFTWIDTITSNWLIPLSGLFTAIFIGWLTKKSALIEEFTQGKKFVALSNPWFFILKFVAPVIVLLIILQQIYLTNI